jgi:hypothetical protein
MWSVDVYLDVQSEDRLIVDNSVPLCIKPLRSD